MKRPFAPLFFATALACSTQAQEQEPAVQEQTHEKGAPLTLEEKLKECQEAQSACAKGIEATFPAFESPDGIPISDEDRKVLSELLTLELPADVAYQHAQQNLCTISLNFEYDHRAIRKGEARCIFLTKHLLLTSFHLVESNYYYFFNKQFYVSLFPLSIDKTGFQWGVDTIVAISPYYDLALLTLRGGKEVSGDVPSIPLGNFNETNPALSYVSFREGGSLQGAAKHYDSGKFDERGQYVPPHIDALLISGKELEPGYSGSPVLQGGKLVGLVWGFDHSADKQVVVIAHYLPQFISKVIAKPPEKKE